MQILKIQRPIHFSVTSTTSSLAKIRGSISSQSNHATSHSYLSSLSCFRFIGSEPSRIKNFIGADGFHCYNNFFSPALVLHGFKSDNLKSCQREDLDRIRKLCWTFLPRWPRLRVLICIHSLYIWKLDLFLQFNTGFVSLLV